MRAHGRMINKMEKEFKYGQMVRNIKDNLLMETNQEKAY
jgi:hypothetical protein